MGFYRRYGKRMLDVVLAGSALVALSPLMLIVACLVRLKLGSPVLFRQERPGMNEKIFTLLKFRSMTDAKDTQGRLRTDEERLTRFGRILRSTSLDELPELINIVRGDMSIVGPRPLLVRYLPYYRTQEKKRHTVRPGLTGLAQVNGRNNLGWNDRLQMDVVYVEHISFIHDVRIVMQTVAKVFKRSDISSGNELRMLDLDEERKNEMEIKP